MESAKDSSDVSSSVYEDGCREAVGGCVFEGNVSGGICGSVEGPDVSQHVPEERDGEDGNVSVYGGEDVNEAESEVEEWASVDVKVSGLSSEDVNETESEVEQDIQDTGFLVIEALQHIDLSFDVSPELRPEES